MASPLARRYIARLVLGYLEKEQFNDTVRAFIQEGAEFLQEQEMMEKEERSLYEILEDYHRLKNEQIEKAKLLSAFTLHFPGLPAQTFGKLNTLLDDYLLCKDGGAESNGTILQDEPLKKPRKASNGTRNRSRKQANCSQEGLMPPPPRMNRLTQILPRPNAALLAQQSSAVSPPSSTSSSVPSPPDAKSFTTFFPLSLPPSFATTNAKDLAPISPLASLPPSVLPQTPTQPTTTTTTTPSTEQQSQDSIALGKRTARSLSSPEKGSRSRKLGSSPKRRKVMQTNTVVSPTKKKERKRKASSILNPSSGGISNTTHHNIDNNTTQPDQVSGVDDEALLLAPSGSEETELGVDEIDLSSFLDEEQFMLLLNSPELHEKLAAHINKTICGAGGGGDNHLHTPSTPSHLSTTNNNVSSPYPTTPYQGYNTPSSTTTTVSPDSAIPPGTQTPPLNLSPSSPVGSLVKIDMVPLDDIVEPLIESLSHDPAFSSIFGNLDWNEHSNVEGGESLSEELVKPHGDAASPPKADAPLADVNKKRGTEEEATAATGLPAGPTVQQFDHKIKEMDVEAFLSGLNYTK